MKRWTIKDFFVIQKPKVDCFTRQEKRIVFTYHEFINSEWWIKQKEGWYSRHKKRCAVCRTEKSVHLHHKKYPKNGRFLSLDDNAFMALCNKHHHMYHLQNGVEQNMQKTTGRFQKRLRQQHVLKNR